MTTPTPPTTATPPAAPVVPPNATVTPPAPEPPSDDAGKQITLTSQQLAERLARAKPADYEDLKAKAAKWDEAEQANKSEIEKANELAATTAAERDAAKAEALRLRIAAKHKLSDDDADLFLTGTDEATLTKQAEALAARSGSSTTPKPDLSQGAHGAKLSGNPAQDFATFMSGQLKH